MAMPQCCYLAKGVKRPSHATNILTFSNNVKIIAGMEFFRGFKSVENCRRFEYFGYTIRSNPDISTRSEKYFTKNGLWN